METSASKNVSENVAEPLKTTDSFEKRLYNDVMVSNLKRRNESFTIRGLLKILKIIYSILSPSK